MALERRNGRVIRIDELSPSVRSVTLALSEPLPFVAGQWINLEATTRVGPQKRAYSIASAPGAELELAVTRVDVGLVSPVIHRFEVGTEVAVDGPYGFFTREGVLAQESALFVGTGTGLAPLRSMLLEAMARTEPMAPATLLFGCRSEEDVLWRDELAAWAHAGKVRIEVTLSRPGPGWTGRTGYVQTHVAELARSLGRPHVYICGLNRMVSEVRRVCKSELGYERAFIHAERYD
jgi:CDP-4-dehydro-6-deoxyglucose reductase